MAQVIITVDSQGLFTIEAQGYAGTSCEQATAALEAALGKVEKRDYQPEYHQTSHSQQHSQIHQ